MELIVRILPPDEKKWYPSECNVCGWTGSSEHLNGGGQIADTGDYDDPYCPCCGSSQVNECDNEIPITRYIDKLYQAGEVIKKQVQLINEYEGNEYARKFTDEPTPGS